MSNLWDPKALYKLWICPHVSLLNWDVSSGWVCRDIKLLSKSIQHRYVTVSLSKTSSNFVCCSFDPFHLIQVVDLHSSKYWCLQLDKLVTFFFINRELMLKWAYDSSFWQSKMVNKITEVGSTAHMPLASHEPRATVHLSFYKVPFHQFFFS